jgi:hypothetical protein
MGRCRWLAAALVLVALSAGAGEIYGTLRQEGKAVGAGVRVDVACGSARASAAGDPYGGYRLYVAAEGRCSLAVTAGRQSWPPIEIFSFASPVRCDLLLAVRGGHNALIRE